jgi:hypothetical protein
VNRHFLALFHHERLIQSENLTQREQNIDDDRDELPAETKNCRHTSLVAKIQDYEVLPGMGFTIVQKGRSGTMLPQKVTPQKPFPFE